MIAINEQGDDLTYNNLKTVESVVFRFNGPHSLLNGASHWVELTVLSQGSNISREATTYHPHELKATSCTPTKCRVQCSRE